MAIAKRMKPLFFENVRIGFRNFSGKEGKYNKEGERNFVVFLDTDVAERMDEEGFNIKYLKPRDEDEQPQAYMQVKVNFNGGRPPKVRLITSRGQNLLDEADVQILDYAEIEDNRVDLIINPSSWDVQGKQGVSAYLSSIAVTIVEDQIDQKYADIPDANAPDSAQSAIGFDLGELSPFDQQRELER